MENRERCPQCSRHCFLTSPGCGRGRRYAEERLGNDLRPAMQEGDAHEHHHGHGHGHRHPHERE